MTQPNSPTPNLPKAKFQTLETDRLILRTPTMDDLDSIMVYAADPEVTRYLRSDVQTRDSITAQLERWIHHNQDNQNQHNSYFTWAVCDKVSSQLMGTISLKIGLEVNPYAGRLGYILAKAYWGRGFMTEAARAIVDL
jgi:ribosomal-protein-alanine N-acetyltransferase